MQHNRFFTAAFISFFLLLSAGCSNSDARYVKVEGTITYKGQAIEGATVSFLPDASDGEPAAGLTDAEGKYTLTSSNAIGGGTGVLPGTYTVRVVKTQSTVTQDPDEAEQRGEIDYSELQRRLSAKGGSATKVKHEEMLPKKYSQPSTTPLKNVSVAKGAGTLDFDLTD